MLGLGVVRERSMCLESQQVVVVPVSSHRQSHRQIPQG